MIATGLVIIAGVLIFAYRDSLSSQNIKNLSGSSGEEIIQGEPFTYEMGSNQAYAPAGDGIAVISATGIQLIDSDGKTVLRQVFSMQNPAIAASRKHTAFFDIGGKTLRVADFSGGCVNLDTDMPIISVTMNSSGWLAVTTEQTGYKGLVQVYNASLEPVYELYSGSKHVLSAHVFPDNKSMAVLCLDERGGCISRYSFQSEEEQESHEAPDELIFDLHIASSGKLWAVSEERLICLDKSLEEIGTYDFGGAHLADYALGDGFSALVLSRYRSGSDGEVLTLDDSCEVIARMDFSRDVQSLGLSKDELAILYSDSLEIYSSRLELKSSREEIPGARGVFFTQSGSAALLMPYGAEIFKP